VLVAALPDWLDPNLLQWVILVAIVVLLYLMYVVVRFVQRAVIKIVLFALLAGIGVSLWVQRTDLQDCARTCECSLYGQTVDVPWDQLPEDVRVRLDDGDVGCRPDIVDAA
jgi:TRAP-type uncharacterized transport system fused permease subunit